MGSAMVCLLCLHITQEVKAMRDMDQKWLWWYTSQTVYSIRIQIS